MKRGRRIGSRFDAPEHSPGFLLWQVSMVWERRQRAALEKIGLTHTQFVMLATIGWLAQAEEPVTQVRIAEHAKLDVVMTSQVLRTLESKRLVSRTAHPTDTRAKCITLTGKGGERVRAAMAVAEREDASFFGHGDALDKPLLEALRLLASNIP